MTLILGIETSCDETSASLLEGEGDAVTLRSLVIHSQDVHRIYGGVVPEIASRAHMRAIVPVTASALREAGVEAGAIDAVAVTHAPGLIGALLVGVSYAKALAWSLDLPVVGVHHMEGHLFATSIEHEAAVPPFTALLVSGGHTLLLDVPRWGEYRQLGATRDDAAGEAFDKCAKLLGLPYPGGRHMEMLAAKAEGARFRFSRPMLRRDQQPGDPDYFDFSFSGIKTAVLLAVRQLEENGPLSNGDRAGIARAFQDAVVETLTAKVVRAATLHSRQRVVLGGGVACNSALQDSVRVACESIGAVMYAPTPRLATDNAAMIARAGLFRFEQGERAPLTLNAFATLPLPGTIAA